MVMYECKSCNFISKIKTHYTRHLKTKKHGNNLNINNKNENKIGVMSTNEHKMSTNEHKMSTNEHKIKNSELHYNCVYCNKTFKNNPNKRRHELHYCKQIPIKNIKIIKELKKEKKDLYKQINKLIDKVGNTTYNTQNNIQLNNYGKEDLSHISESLMTNLLKTPYGMIPKLIEEVHFNKNKPENQNIALTNKKENIIKVFSGNKWIYKNKDETINDLMDGKYFILDSHYESNSQYITKVNKYEKFRKFYDEKDKIMIESLKKQCELIILNNR